jgi:hypothetical protein
MKHVFPAVAVGAVVGLLVLASGPGCNVTLFKNQTAERSGNITVQFVNETPYRAIFSYGVWDSLDLDPPGPITLRQLRLEGNTTSATVNLTCARNFAIGTEAMLERAEVTEATDTDNFDVQAFVEGVKFSDQPAGSELEAAATAGRATGIERLLADHFTCDDLLLVTFVADPSASGGFRIDFSVVQDENE